jgi:hypothetical protein
VCVYASPNNSSEKKEDGVRNTRNRKKKMPAEKRQGRNRRGSVASVADVEVEDRMAGVRRVVFGSPNTHKHRRGGKRGGMALQEGSGGQAARRTEREDVCARMCVCACRMVRWRLT